MSTRAERVVGQKISVHVLDADGETVSIAARVQWRLKTPDGYTCGCAFSNRECFGQLHNLIERRQREADQAKPETPDPPPRPSLWIALAALVVFVFPSFLVAVLKRGSHPQAVAAFAENVDEDANEPEDADAPEGFDADVRQESTLAKPIEATEPRDVEPTLAATDEEILAAAEQIRRLAANLDASIDDVLNVELPPLAFLAGDALGAAVEEPADPTRTFRDPLRQPGNPADTRDAPDSGTTVRNSTKNESDSTQAPADPPPSEFRTWSDATGRYRVVARAIALEGSAVRLLKENGRLATVPIARLSDEDRLYLESWRSGGN
jgi:hypothetical protein